MGHASVVARRCVFAIGGYNEWRQPLDSMLTWAPGEVAWRTECPCPFRYPIRKPACSMTKPWSSGPKSLPASSSNGLMAALQRAEGCIRFIQTRHEESAAFMACAHAKFTGVLRAVGTT